MAKYKGLICDESKNKNIEARITWEVYTNYFSQETRFSATLSLKGKGSFNGKVSGVFAIRGYSEIQSSGKTEIILSNTVWTPVAFISEALPNSTSTFGIEGRIYADGEAGVVFSGVVDAGDTRTYVTASSFSTDSEFINAPMVVDFLPNGIYFMELKIEVGDETIRTTHLGRLQAITTTETIEFTKEELKAIYEAHTETRDCLVNIHLTPYFGEGYSNPLTEYEGTITTTLVIPINEDTMPTADISIIPLNSLNPPYSEKFVKGVTMAKAEFKDAAAKYGAGIVSYELIIGENRYSNPPISDYLLYSRPMKALAVLTDTRGISVSHESTIEVLDYARPAVVPATGNTRIVCTRCNDDGTLSDSGTSLKIIARRQYYPMANTNTCALMYRIAESGANIENVAWNTLLDFNDINDDVDKDKVVSNGSLAPDKTYDVEIKAVDRVGDETYVSFFIPTESVYYHKAVSQNSFGIGKYVKEGLKNVIDIDENFDIILRMEKWKETEGDGCKYYRFAGGNHVKVAVNVGITLTNTVFPKTIATLPELPESEDVRPTKVIYGIVTTTGQEVAGIKIDEAGNVSVEWIYRLGGNPISESEVVVIDGYIDYLIK